VISKPQKEPTMSRQKPDEKAPTEEGHVHG